LFPALADGAGDVLTSTAVELVRSAGVAEVGPGALTGTSAGVAADPALIVVAGEGVAVGGEVSRERPACMATQSV
jgi:hypothetical protein